MQNNAYAQIKLENNHSKILHKYSARVIKTILMVQFDNLWSPYIFSGKVLLKYFKN